MKPKPIKKNTRKKSDRHGWRKCRLRREQLSATLTKSAMKAAMADAVKCFPEESCGLVLRGGYQPCDNLAADPQKTFKIDNKIVLNRLRDNTLLAVIHSHPYPHPPTPSYPDMVAQLAMGVPWGIVPVGQDGDAGAPFFWGDGVPVPPLLERPYRYGVLDCYSICRDWYQLERNITLPDYPREWAWWKRKDGANMYEQYFSDAGFVEIDAADAQVGDSVLIALGHRGIVSHVGVICESGVMLHHPGGELPYDPTRLSRRDPLSRWQPHIRRVLRYQPSVPGTQEVVA